MQAAPLRITSLSGLIGWEAVTWASGAISLDASLVNDVHHTRLAMLPAARSRRAVPLAVGCKMPITCLAFATLWPIACLANYIHHTRQLVVAAPYGRASLPVRPGETVARNSGATFWPIMLASLILSHLTSHHCMHHNRPCVFNAAALAPTRWSCYAAELLRTRRTVMICSVANVAPSLLRHNDSEGGGPAGGMIWN